MKVLPALLGVSLLLNVALLARRAEPAPSLPKPARSAAVVVEAPFVPGDVVAPKCAHELDVARAEAIAPPDRLAAFREKVSRAMKLWKDSRALASAAPETHLELSEVTLEMQRAKLERFKNPRAYADLLGVVLEQAAVALGKPLGEAQLQDLRRALADYQMALAGLEEAGAWECYLREVGPEAEALQRLRAFLTRHQEAKLMPFGALSPWGAPAPWVARTHAEPQLIQHWMSAYGLDDAQKPAVTAAARVYLNAAEALNTQMGDAASPGQEALEWRRRTGSLLIDALGALEGSLPAELRDRLRQRRPAEFLIYNPGSVRPER